MTIQNDAQSIRIPNVNEVRVSGRVVSPPRVFCAVGKKALVHFRVSVNRWYRERSGIWRLRKEFVPVKAWSVLAEACGQRMVKGSPVYVEGRLKTDLWKTETGERRVAVQIEASKIQFLKKVEIA
jgi:single-strand DNA-binding protein